MNGACRASSEDDTVKQQQRTIIHYVESLEPSHCVRVLEPHLVSGLRHDLCAGV